MPSYEPAPVGNAIRITCRGLTFSRDGYRGSWWRERPVDEQQKTFLGAEHNLPKDVLRKLKAGHYEKVGTA